MVPEPHLQTLWGPLLRRGPRPALARERVATPDGDFVDLDWLPGRRAGAPLVVVLHGLEGSSRSHYVGGLLAQAAHARLARGRPEFPLVQRRAEPLARFYHSGRHRRPRRRVRRLVEREPACGSGVVGVSLGGNVLLKWLGERGAAAPGAGGGRRWPSRCRSTSRLRRACSTAGSPRLYTASFLAHHEGQDSRKARAPHGRRRRAGRARGANLRGVRPRGDGAAARLRQRARLLGAGEQRPYLPPHPAADLLINALDDPFMPASALPRAAAPSPAGSRPRFVPDGGHAGFLEGALGRRSWAERRAVAFLRRHLLG